MSSSRDCTYTESPPANDRRPPPSLSGHPSLGQVSSRRNEVDVTELGVPPRIPARLQLVTEQRSPPNLTHDSLYPPGRLRPNSLSIGYEFLVITATAILTIQLQLLTSGSMATTTTTRALLFFGMTFELLGILLAICFLPIHQYSEDLQRLPALVRLALGVPIVLVLMGIVGLAAVLVVEMLKTSLTTAVAMSSFLVFGIMLCLWGLWKCGKY